MSKKDSTIPDFLDALADVIAHRAASMVIEASKAPTVPERVPKWLFSKDRARHRRRSRTEGARTTEQALRDAGMITMGDPGYEELLSHHLLAVRAREAERHCRAQARRAARLLQKLIDAQRPTQPSR